MITAIKEDAKTRMEKTVSTLQETLSKVRTGRAHPSLIDHLKIDYYGSEVPLSQVASITIADARTLTVSPWEKTMVPVIEKAIISSDLGLNPAVSGTVMHIPLPALTEERRRDLVKVVKSEAENARVAVRNIRRDANHHLKELVKAKEISEDDERRAGESIQKLTDSFIAKVDACFTQKESELMEV